MSCSQCNRPCIRVGGKCIIAIVRKETNCSFQDAWESITHTHLSDSSGVAYIINEDKIDSLLNKQHKLIKHHDNKNKKRIPSKV